MEVVAYDPFVATELYNTLKVQRADSPDDVYAAADFLTLHMPTTDETNGMINADALAKMRDGVRILNVARGSLIVDEDLEAALDSGKVGGAALDVFRSEPITEHPLFGYPNVVVTPHLGASTAEATDRAGYQAAEQVVAALQGGSVTTAVNAPAISAEDMELLSPFLPLCRQLGKLATALASCGSIDKIEIECHGRIGRARHRPAGDRRRARRARRAHGGLDQRRQRAVDRGASAASRSCSRAATRRATTPTSCASPCGAAASARTASSARRSGACTARTCWRPGGSASTCSSRSTSRCFATTTCPGVIGRVGTMLGEHGVNIGSAAVGHTPPTPRARPPR